MINITGDTYTVSHLEIPDAVRSRWYKKLQRMLGKRDASLPTLAEFNGIAIPPFITPEGAGTLLVIYEGVTYVREIT